MTGLELKALRESAGLNQTELAKLVRVFGQVTISNYENGKRSISEPMALLFELLIQKHLPDKARHGTFLESVVNIRNRVSGFRGLCIVLMHDLRKKPQLYADLEKIRKACDTLLDATKWE